VVLLVIAAKNILVFITVVSVCVSASSWNWYLLFFLTNIWKDGW